MNSRKRKTAKAEQHLEQLMKGKDLNQRYGVYRTLIKTLISYKPNVADALMDAYDQAYEVLDAK